MEPETCIADFYGLPRPLGHSSPMFMDTGGLWNILGALEEVFRAAFSDDIPSPFVLCKGIPGCLGRSVFTLERFTESSFSFSMPRPVGQCGAWPDVRRTQPNVRACAH